MQGKPRALVTTGVTWLASLDPPQSGQLQNKKTTQACFHHRASSRAPLVSQAGRPAFLSPSPLILLQSSSPRWEIWGRRCRAPGVVSRLGTAVRTHSGCLWRGHQGTKQWPWLGLCLPQTPWSRVSKKQKQDLSAPESPRGDHCVLSWNQGDAPGKGAARTPPNPPQSQVRG